MEEVSASFSSHLFRGNRNRAYLPNIHSSLSRDSAVSAEDPVQLSVAADCPVHDYDQGHTEGGIEGKGRSRLHRNELLKIKQAKAVHPFDGDPTLDAPSQTLPCASDMPTISLAAPSMHTFALHGADTMER